MSEPRRLRLTDPAAMRALGHPTRLRLLGELRTHGPQSVGALSALVDEAVGSVSYHLGTLARHGFVEPAPELARDRRESWWRAAHASTEFEPLDAHGDPERQLAMTVLRRAILAGYLDSLEKALAAEPTLPSEWVRASISGDTMIHLTADELAELRGELEALAERWDARSDSSRPDARPVAMIYHAFRTEP
ncbi:helix-turn-helix domain-containing protein [Pilimelia columellifera]|uniref:Winged helix-turn-helix domain-containing protein n=1 Tax=Pilimelia columellifera subsp. columellifera TaxID=706583 RepID=A0ABP6AW99_9ACTN